MLNTKSVYLISIGKPNKYEIMCNDFEEALIYVGSYL